MKKRDAERAIVAEMKRRLPQIPYRGVDGGLVEYEKLAKERPDLFDFASPAPKWQLVQGWLRKHGVTG